MTQAKEIRTVEVSRSATHPSITNEGLKDCAFDCSDGKQARNFNKNLKRLSIYAAGKYERGAEITTLIDELVEVEISKPKFYEGSDPGEQRIYDLKINQYVINQEKLETEIKKL